MLWRNRGVCPKVNQSLDARAQSLGGGCGEQLAKFRGTVCRKGSKFKNVEHYTENTENGKDEGTETSWAVSD